MTTPFSPQGHSVPLAVTTTVSAAVQITAAPSGWSQYRFFNDTGDTVYLGYGATSTQAVANTPTAAPTASGTYLALGTGITEVLSLGPNMWFAGLAKSGTGTMHITPGIGV